LGAYRDFAAFTRDIKVVIPDDQLEGGYHPVNMIRLGTAVLKNRAMRGRFITCLLPTHKSKLLVAGV
jgi:hypothetical protein